MEICKNAIGLSGIEILNPQEGLNNEKRNRLIPNSVKARRGDVDGKLIYMKFNNGVFDELLLGYELSARDFMHCYDTMCAMFVRWESKFNGCICGIQTDTKSVTVFVFEPGSVERGEETAFKTFCSSPLGYFKSLVKLLEEDFHRTFQMPIGDWSYDGHGRCEAFLATSDKPLWEVREAHFGIKEKLGIDIEFDGDHLSGDEVRKLRLLGYDLAEKDAIGFPAGYDDPDEYCPSVDGLIDLWVFLLNTVNPELNVALLKKPEYPMLQFYGDDSNGRHISSVGYGVI